MKLSRTQRINELKKAENLGSEINEQISSNLENAKKIVGQQGNV